MTVRGFFAGLLMVLGVSIVTLSGLCSLYFIALALMQLLTMPLSALGLLARILLVGAIPVLLGLDLIASARRLRSRGPSD